MNQEVSAVDRATKIAEQVIDLTQEQPKSSTLVDFKSLRESAGYLIFPNIPTQQIKAEDVSGMVMSVMKLNPEVKPEELN